MISLLSCGYAENQEEGFMIISDFQIRQPDANVWMCAYKNEIFIFIPRGSNRRNKYTDCIISLSKGEIVYKFDYRIKILGYSNGIIYFVAPEENIEGTIIGMFDMSIKNINWLECDYKIEHTRTSVYMSSESICIPIEENSDGYNYAVVSGKSIISYKQEVPVTYYKDVYYYLSRPYPMKGIYNGVLTEDVITKGIDGNEKRIELDGASIPLSIFQISESVVLYCINGRTPLSIIESDQKITPVFTFDCLMSESSIALHENKIFLSVRRYREFGPLSLGYLIDSNDDLEGLYTINMSDFSVRKISDSFYTGLYNLDGTCLYGCDTDGNVYKIAFDGASQLIFSP